MVRAVVTIALLLFVTGCYTDGIEDTNYSAPPSNSEFQQMLIDVHEDVYYIDVFYQGADTQESVTSIIILPSIGRHGSRLTWSSSNPAVISLTEYKELGFYLGEINRPGSKTDVILTVVAHQYDLGAVWNHTFTVLAL